MDLDGPSLLMFHRASQLMQSGRVQDEAEAAALIREVAERSGAAAAQHELGNVYMFGIGGVPMNCVLAVVWYGSPRRRLRVSWRHNTPWEIVFSTGTA